MGKNDGNTDILHIFTDNETGLSLSQVIGKAIAVLGVRGSGKTNSSAVLVEELLTKGVPVIVFDVDGEYWTLREKYDILIISPDEKSDVHLNINDEKQAVKLARALLKTYTPAVLDLSEFVINEYNNYLVSFIEEIWKNSRLYRRPIFLVIEEAHEFIPQGSTTPAKKLLVRIALRGRKRGIGLVMVSQRSAKVDKDVLSQAEYYILHKVIHPADLRVYKELLPLDPKEIENIVPKLKIGEALFYDGISVKIVKIRKRHTYHIGYTPQMQSKKSFKLRTIDKSLLEKILSLIESQNYIISHVNNNETNEKIKQDFNNSQRMPNNCGNNISTFALEKLVELITILARSPPSIIAQLYTLAKENRWLNYSKLREHSKYKTINTKEIKRLKRLGLIKIEKNGREIFVKQNFLTETDEINELIIESLRIISEKRMKKNKCKDKQP